MFGRIAACFLAFSILISSDGASAAEARSYKPPANTPVIPWTRFSLQYAVRVVGNAKAARVEFYITDNGGKTWRKYGEDKDMISPMVISVPNEGTYGLVTVVSTNVRPGLAPRPGTRPDRFVIVDRTPPQAHWIAPTQEQILITDNGINLSWEATDQHLGLTPVAIEYSTDNGNFWLPLREKLPAKGSINWTPPVMNGEENIALRLIATDLAGNKRIVRNKASFTLDNQPPVVTILGPSSSGNFKFDIDYNVEDIESGVSKVELFYTVDGGQDWFYFGPDNDLQAPLTFSSPAAREVGLYIVATDKSGNKTPPPARGARPMAVVSLDMEPPQVNILPPFTTSGEVIPKDEVVEIRWNASDLNIKNNSALIQISRDGGATWNDIAYDKPANGVWEWVPREAGNNLLLKISVSDVMGNTGTAISMPFSVDQKRPELEFESISPLKSQESTDINKVSSQPEEISQDINNDIWAPPVPSTMELESETVDVTEVIADVPPVTDNNFSPVAENTSIEDNPFGSGDSTEIPGIQVPDSEIDNISLTEDITAPVEEESISETTDDFSDINFDDIVADETVSESDEFSLTEDISTEDIAEEIPAPADADNLSEIIDKDVFENIPDIPGFEEVSETTVEEVTEPEVKEVTEAVVDSIPDIPAPDSTDTIAQIPDDIVSDSTDISIPDIPNLISETETTETTDFGIPEIPNIQGGVEDETLDEVSETVDSVQNEVTDEITEITENTEDIGSVPAIPDLPSPDSGNDADLGLPLNIDAEVPATPTVPADKLLAMAQSAFEEEQDLEKAQQFAEQVIAQDPQNAQAYAVIASVLTEKGNFDSAFDYAHKAINIAPDNAQYLQILGYAQYQKASEINKMLGDTDLTPAQAANLRSQLLTSLDQAQVAYSKMLSSTNPEEIKEGYYRLAQVDYFKATRIIEDEQQAAESLRKAIANYQKAYSIGQPDYREVLQIGICNYRLMDYDQAEQWLEKAQEITPAGRTPKEAFFYLALINEKTNRNMEALPFWEKVAEYYPADSSYHKLAESRIKALSGM